MSGHSKWSTIKRAKEGKDAKRSNLFTKLSKNIAVAARDGADPEMNFKLRMAIDKARSLSMPKDNIERAIKKGSGDDDSARIESYLYEGYGPGGVALIVEILTDNKNRSVSNLKHILTKHGGNLGGDGSVQWMFATKGQISLDKASLNDDEEMQIIEAGAEDIDTSDEKIKVITALDNLEAVKNKLQESSFEVESSEMIYLAKEKVVPTKEEQLLNLMNSLDDDDDVNNIYTNAEI
ncbi:MAG: YebC/PmpR family DNA-binding transcriptional regulator [Candidatus Komeilibacteria bacterium]|jgi:YebC/PmpR family DNA-binding regulatory protein|nr:YebC/PmpR family DNA-binding transcriptional regulator [Candidatus Komeilibacteria bacterium]MBT4447465.1 YebC/PmpR family DNA-binding transcriptional regulator [Candidatus Komeilibacteria bacterium]